jgi:hypothetical protein
MEEIKKIMGSWWFKAAAYGTLGTALLVYGYPLYAGIAYGVGVTEFFKVIKK